MNLSQLQDDVLSRLGEAADSLCAAFMSGTNSATVTKSSRDIITGLVNDGQNDLARNYFLIAGTGTYVWPTGTMLVLLSDFTCSNGTLFAVRSVNFGGVVLNREKQSVIENWYSTLDTDTLAVPVDWYYSGLQAIGTAPVPLATTTTVTVRGFVYPLDLVLPNSTPVFPTDSHNLLSWYACWQILTRNTNDPVLLSRGNAFRDLYLNGANNFMDRMKRSDPQLARDLLDMATMIPQATQG